MKKLILVESPSKAKTIEKYLGSKYKVQASMGHVIDLPSKGLNVDVEHDYKPNFVVMDDKKKILNQIKKEVKKADEIYLAMDPDREGEAIAYHLAQALKLKTAQQKRITFHEITKEAVEKAVKNPGKIDNDLVQAQFARRVLDRLVGYKLSSIIWTKMWYGLSAGRVQSPALRMIVQREEEIRTFVPEEFWNITAHLSNKNVRTVIKKMLAEKDKISTPSETVSFILDKIGSKKLSVKKDQDADKIVNDLLNEQFEVTDVVERVLKKNPYPPFTTSSLQQAGNNVYGFTAKRTMDSAQRLYQNGLITYMRTDSVNLSSKAISQIRAYISSKIGKDYLPQKALYYKNRARISQEAHEAIRPTDLNVKNLQGGKIKEDDKKIYDLIWKRAVASQMESKLIGSVSIMAKVKDKYIFKSSSSKLIFDGWSKVFGGKDEDLDATMPFEIKKGDKLNAKQIDSIQKFTQPKPRYTEASLIKALESYGIGRPSTYASIINVILARKYVQKEGKALKPTDIGELVSNFLTKHFNNLVDYEYTAGVEESLDKIAVGKEKLVPFIDSQYKPMIKTAQEVKDNVSKDDVLIIGKSDKKCPKCSASMVIKVGRYGKFYSCSKFPKCDGLESFEKELTIKDGASESSVKNSQYLNKDKYKVPSKCDKCGSDMQLKNGRFGAFWACTNYPKCKNIVSITLLEKCPECESNLVERRGKWGRTFIGCSNYPNCRYIKKAQNKKKK